MNNLTIAQAAQLPIEKLRPFEGHPFQVKDDAEMGQLVYSILAQGLLTPISVRPIENNEYEVIYEAPPNKDYKELKLIFACHENTIDLVTIMPNFQTATNRQKKKYQSDKQKDIEKKRLKAISKRKW